MLNLPSLSSRAPGAPVRWLRGAAIVAVVLAHAGARADDEAVRAQVRQKIQLGAALLADQAVLARVAASGQPAAISHLDEGRVHHEVARDELARGNLAAARKAIDDALRHLAAARRLAPDAAGRQAALRERHEQRLASTERLVEAWRSRAASASRDEVDAVVAAVGLLEASRRAAAEGRFDDAQSSLAQVERELLAGTSRVLGTSVDYTPRFAHAGEEYAHEIARHQSLVELLPIAIRDLRPNDAALARVEHHRAVAADLRARAAQEHASGRSEQALAPLRESIVMLQRALAAAGVVVPGEARN